MDSWIGRPIAPVVKTESVRDPRLTQAKIESFAPRFRDDYSPDELARLDLFLVAQWNGRCLATTPPRERVQSVHVQRPKTLTESVEPSD